MYPLDLKSTIFYHTTPQYSLYFSIVPINVRLMTGNPMPRWFDRWFNARYAVWSTSVARRRPLIILVQSSDGKSEFRNDSEILSYRISGLLVLTERFHSKLVLKIHYFVPLAQATQASNKPFSTDRSVRGTVGAARSSLFILGDNRYTPITERSAVRGNSFTSSRPRGWLSCCPL